MSYKPRNRPQGRDASPFVSAPRSNPRRPVTKDGMPSFPLAAFFWPAKGGLSTWLVLPLILLIVGLYRWALGFWGYSGFQSPPMHGDFEAQRHWMEITSNLPITQWYFHDLEWWGLDYPPLTAYHSWLLGKVGSSIDASWFELHTSRGLDNDMLKVYMRATVLVSEYLTYIPAVIFFVRRFSRIQQVSGWEASIALTAILLQPGTMLIDHAHFQYNTVMLGLVAATMSCLLADKLLWASILFVTALNFKQMALYYAPVVFAYLLGKCVVPRINIPRLLAIALATVVTFALMLSPLILGALYDTWRGISTKDMSPSPLLDTLAISSNAPYYGVALQLTQCIHRIFPFARGLFEDKVANVWCALHTFHKLHRYPTELLQRLSLGATALSIFPPFITILFYPERNLIPLAMATTGWGFFLFSFQVHEKSVLLPLLPMTLLLAGKDGLQPRIRAWVTWANILACWTMYPLLKRDELKTPYVVLTLLWAWLMGAHKMTLDSFSSDPTNSPGFLVGLLHGGFYIAMIVWHAAEALITPPIGKPDFWVVINVLIGCAGFGICYLWCLWHLISPILVKSSGKATKSKAQ